MQHRKKRHLKVALALLMLAACNNDALAVCPYDPACLNNPYSPDSINNPYGAGNPYSNEKFFVVPSK